MALSRLADSGPNPPPEAETQRCSHHAGHLAFQAASASVFSARGAFPILWDAQHDATIKEQRSHNVRIEDVRRVLIVGAGTMGQQIGLQCVMHGYDVMLYDIAPEALETAAAQVRAIW